MTLETALETVAKDYDVRQRKTAADLACRSRHLVEYFADRKLEDITADSLMCYVLHRREAQASNATINREVAALRRAFTLTRTPWIPEWKALPESEPRQGRITRAMLDAIIEHLPEKYVPITLFLYHTGWRVSEALGMTWGDVDLVLETLRLPARLSKSGKARKIPLISAVRLVLAELNYGTGSEKLFPEIPYSSYHYAFRVACKRAGYPDALLHDFRRSAITRMVREARIDRRTAMRLSGHATESAFVRYEVEDEEYLREAAQRLSDIS